MRLAAIYDVHGNLPALEAVLSELQTVGVDEIVVGGDMVPGPHPAETIDTLRALSIPTQVIRGNGEREVLALLSGSHESKIPESVRKAMSWVGQQLNSEQIEFLNQLPSVYRIEIPYFGQVLFCHATPRNDTEIFTRLTPERRVEPAFAQSDASLVICGHTHMQFDRQIGSSRVVNAGSVGMPFGQPGAEWVLLDTDVEFRRTLYNLAAACERIRNTQYPGADEFAAKNVMTTPTESEMLQVFERAAIR